MSSLIVSVTRISKVRPHPNADRLDIAEVLGWQVVVGRGEFRDGEKVVYFPPDTILPQDISDRFNVTKYLPKGRVRCASLRGESSFGLVVKPDDESWPEGTDVADHYRATKYEPPIRTGAGDAQDDHPLFHQYTDMEDLRNFPEAFKPGEEVVITEKIDGTNCRVGLVEGEFMAGSHTLRRKRPADDDKRTNLYWYPLLSIEGVRTLLESYRSSARRAILFGEVFGTKVQDFDYGRKNCIDFLAFDLSVDGRYLDYDEFRKAADGHGVQVVPVAYRGPFSLDVVREQAEATSTVGGSRYREGVVVRPVVERMQEIGKHVHRAILKYKSDKYLLGGHTDYKDT